jgi:ribosomal protein RSM22 (predicted rRNA methylase)
LFGRFPEQVALLKNPFKEEREMKKIHPLSPERRPAEAARALAASSKLVERADDKTAVAFAATSLPARYATVLRILEELKFRDKRWQPTTVLDYCSGPGCGMWAAMQVCAAYLLS